MNLRAMNRLREQFPEWNNDLLFTLPRAIGVGVFLLLFMGNFGQNLFRFTWLWYGGFLIIARHCAERRVANWEPVPEYEVEEEIELPPGWVLHPPHA